MRWILVVTLLASLCQGCFVFDELDKGQKLMDEQSPRARTEAAQKEQPSVRHSSARAREEPEEGILADLREWWRKKREPAPPKRDPDDVVVRCQVGGSTQFTRKSDCTLKGGRAI